MNPLDSRNRSAFEIVEELKKSKKLKLAILGSHAVDPKLLAAQLPSLVKRIYKPVGFVVTGCAPAGVEKAARLAAKEICGRSAVIFHRAEMLYGVKKAEKMRDVLVVQQSDALLVISAGEKRVCRSLIDLFYTNKKLVYEVEVE